MLPLAWTLGHRRRPFPGRESRSPLSNLRIHTGLGLRAIRSARISGRSISRTQKDLSVCHENPREWTQPAPHSSGVQCVFRPKLITHIDLVHEREGGRGGVGDTVHAKDARGPAPQVRRGPVQPPDRPGDRHLMLDGLGDRGAPEARGAHLAAA